MCICVCCCSTSVAYRRRRFAPDSTWVLLPVCTGVCVCKACVPHCFAVGDQSGGASTGPEAEEQKRKSLLWERENLSIIIITFRAANNNSFH